MGGRWAGITQVMLSEERGAGVASSVPPGGVSASRQLRNLGSGPGADLRLSTPRRGGKNSSMPTPHAQLELGRDGAELASQVLDSSTLAALERLLADQPHDVAGVSRSGGQRTGLRALLLPHSGSAHRG